MTTLTERLRQLPPQWKRRAKTLLATAAAPLASTTTRDVLAKGLDASVRARFWREWHFAAEPPHFTDHQGEMFTMAFANATADALFFSRAFFAAELLREGDVVLDIGFGSGFFTKRFFAPRAAHIDAIDNEPSAVATASRVNPHPRVRYTLADAVREPFPQARYDVIVWDGAIGHFTREGADHVLRKIAAALAPNGVFCGSESLGHEGDDHLQTFASLDDLRARLAPHFAIVSLRDQKMQSPSGYTRHEAYWRCAQTPERLDAVAWRR